MTAPTIATAARIGNPKAAPTLAKGEERLPNPAQLIIPVKAKETNMYTAVVIPIVRSMARGILRAGFFTSPEGMTTASKPVNEKNPRDIANPIPVTPYGNWLEKFEKFR